MAQGKSEEISIHTSAREVTSTYYNGIINNRISIHTSAREVTQSFGMLR